MNVEIVSELISKQLLSSLFLAALNITTATVLTAFFKGQSDWDTNYWACRIQFTFVKQREVIGRSDHVVVKACNA